MLPPRSKSSDAAGETGYRTKAEWAYLQVRGWIQSGILEPEERLDQEELAARLGISRIPLRQALVKLQSDGLIVSRPHAGATVAPLSLTDAEDIYAARAVLEPMLTEAAAATMGEEAIGELRQIVARQETAGEAGDRLLFLDLDREFHERLYHGAGYRISLDLVNRLRDLSERYVALYQGDAQRSQATLSEHDEILGHCAARDGAAAAAAMRDHIRHGIEYLRKRAGAPGSDISE
ncbi:GntR family transcriptional regulator [Roseovarius spongiae]|nr:GntR family transcriptional regulator [Roseovarius spongiae]